MVRLSQERSGSARQRLVGVSEAWGVIVREISLTPSSLVALGTRDGVPVVVKIALVRHDEWDAGTVISAFRGAGMVRALEHAPGAVLLERLSPGTPLVALVQEGHDDEAIQVLASVIRAMLDGAPDVQGRPTAMDWAAGFERYFASGDRPLPMDLVEVGQAFYDELCATQGPVRLLHGDLHHYNVLLDRRRGWLAIDPKGVVAEVEFEIGAALRNPHGMPELHATDALQTRAERFSSMLGLDLSRVLRWAFAQAVLAAIWMVEDGERCGRDAPILAIARALESLVA